MGILLIFFIALRSPTDPDMGWHLKDGEYLLAHNLQVAKTDIFSYTMPEFPLIMHEWLADVWMYVIYRKSGLFFLSVIFAFISGAAFIFASFGVKARREHKVIAALLGTIASIPVLGVRPQMLNLLGLAVVLFIIFRFRSDPKTKLVYGLPPLFLLWVNMHGGFSVGLFFIGIFVGFEAAKLALKKILVKTKPRKFLESPGRWLGKNTLEFEAVLKLAGLLVISFLATLINPYSWRVYVEIFTTIFDKYAKANIGEWMPIVAGNPMSFQFIIYLVLLGILLLMSLRQLDLTYFVVTMPFLYLAFSSWRHMPIFLIISTPFWVNIVEYLAGTEILKIIRRKWFLLLMICALAVTARQQLQKVFPVSASVEKLAKAGNYPLGAVEYLRQNPIEGKMLNEYNWGGFLIWQYPEKKTFIDGRMPSWKMGDRRIFEEFNRTISYEEGWDKTLEKYDVRFSLVYNNPVNRVMFESIGWKQAYSDNLAAVYKKD